MTTKLNLVVNQGANFSTVFSMKAANGAVIDLSSYTGASMMRRHYTSTNSISFSVSLDSSGDVSLALSSNVTANVEPGRYLYDVDITSSTGYVTRILEGIVNVKPTMTR